ncbi:MAG: bifunctional glutamate N-acetyltransferase/amino-acid acetyltransferase ArgJ [Candidatus Omnitrophica bacterium]|nr:bifunctional glutamate N-acetyltransferase/amino-acid acetyltransferase ArgJ [Candidatus Omnitrophota bacterium]
MKIPKGFLFSGISCGIKNRLKPDLGLVYAPEYAQGVYFFTGNRVKAAPLLLGRAKLKKTKGKIKALLVNSGNANCFTGQKGIQDAEYTCKAVADILRIDSRYVIPSSTGVIGKRLPLRIILESLPQLVCGLDEEPSAFSQAILTTDSFKKIACREFRLKGKAVRILGIAKGAGMIYPRLKQATMLAFIFTDLNIKNALLNKISKNCVDLSFNSISVDGCCSTNDSVFVLSSKKVGIRSLSSKDLKVFSEGLSEVCLDLAKKIVQDGEGATKFIAITIKGAVSRSEARKAAFSIANSSLFKTAIYGENPNWGRIIQAVGQADISLKENVSIKSTSLKSKNIDISVDLKRGGFSWTVYTCDFSPEYIKINAQYS